jgi:hypothetical protein
MTRGWYYCLGISLYLAACGESQPGQKVTEGGDGAGASAGNGGASAGSGATQAGGSGTGDPTSLDAYPGQYAQAVCAVLERCWMSFSEGLTESCASYFERELREGDLSNVVAAVDDGRIEYHADRAQACFDALAATSCDEGFSLAADDCEQVFVGSLEAGAPCTLDLECAGQAQCLVEASCPGTCGARAKEGETCTSANRCEVDLICQLELEAGTCVAAGTRGDACSATQPCASLLRCAGLDRSDPNSTGTCEPLDSLYSGALDEPCGIGADRSLCEPGLVCVLESQGGMAVGVCQEGVASSAACQYALPDACPEREYCRIADTEAMPLVGTCTPWPELGEECAYSDVLSAPCASEQHCSIESGLCEPGMQLGETCADNQDCFSRSCIEGTCVALLECERAAL